MAYRQIGQLEDDHFLAAVIRFSVQPKSSERLCFPDGFGVDFAALRKQDSIRRATAVVGWKNRSANSSGPPSSSGAHLFGQTRSIVNDTMEFIVGGVCKCTIADMVPSFGQDTVVRKVVPGEPSASRFAHGRPDPLR